MNQEQSSRNVGDLRQATQRLHRDNIARWVLVAALICIGICVVVVALVMWIDSGPPKCIDPKASEVAATTTAPIALQMRIVSAPSAPHVEGMCLTVQPAAKSGSRQTRAFVVAAPVQRADPNQQWNFSEHTVNGWRLFQVASASGVHASKDADQAWRLVKPCAQASIDGTCGGVVTDKCPLMLTSKSSAFQGFAPCTDDGGGSVVDSDNGTVVACSSSCIVKECNKHEDCPTTSSGPAASLKTSPYAAFLLNTLSEKHAPCGYVMEEAAFEADQTGLRWSIDSKTLRLQWDPKGDIVVAFVKVQPTITTSSS